MIYLRGQSVDTSLPGVYIEEIQTADNNITVNQQSVPAVVGTANWGPKDAILSITRVSDALRYYGDREGGNLVKFIETLLTEGAGVVRCYRIEGSGGVAATITWAAGVATTWGFTSLYTGTRGNDITIQVVAGSLINTVTVVITMDRIVETIPNVTNVSTDANYIGTVFESNICSFVKTGTATTLPTPGAAVNLASGANGATPADGDYVTGLVAFESDLTIRLVACACIGSVAIRTGLLNHCTLIGNRVYFMSPVATTVATVVTEMGSYADQRGVIVFPYLEYYNLETSAYEHQQTAWYMGICASLAPNQSPANRKIKSGNLSMALTRQEKIDLNTAHVATGAPNSYNSYYSLNQPLEYRDSYWGTVQIRRIYDEIESTMDTVLVQFINYNGSLTSLKADIYGCMTSIIEEYKRLGWAESYVLDVNANTAETRENGESYCGVYLQVNKAIEKVFVQVGRLSDYQVVVNEEVV